MKSLIITLISAISICSVSAQKYTDIYIYDANKVALSWLNDINHNQYENAYNLLTDKTQSQYRKEEWVIFMQELMNEFGQLKERIITNSTFNSSLEGLEDGFYVIIEYNANYENTINHEEYLLLQQNYKAKWEVVSFNYKFTKLDGSK